MERLTNFENFINHHFKISIGFLALGLFFGILYLYFLHSAISKVEITSVDVLLLTVIGIFAASVNERAAIMIAIISVFSLIFYGNQIQQKNFKVFLIFSLISSL